MKICSIEGCNREHHAKGLCTRHYDNRYYHENKRPLLEVAPRFCSVEGCSSKHRARGYCNKHYRRWTKGLSLTARTNRDPNEFVDCGTHHEIYLYDKDGNHIASAKIDSEDVEKCQLYRWHLNGAGYVVSDKGKSRIWLHRYILDLTDQFIEGDHVQGNILDCQKNQLRMADNFQNAQNTKLLNTNTSGERNVSWNKYVEKWQVNIEARGKRHYFGIYNNFDEACQVARTERKRLHKEFTRDV